MRACARVRVSVKSQQEAAAAAAAGSIPGKENRPENEKQFQNNSLSGNNPREARAARSLFHMCARLFRWRRPPVCWLYPTLPSPLFLLFLHTDAASPSSSLSLRPSAALSLRSHTKLRRIRRRVSGSRFQNKTVSVVKPDGVLLGYMAEEKHTHTPLDGILQLFGIQNKPKYHRGRMKPQEELTFMAWMTFFRYHAEGWSDLIPERALDEMLDGLLEDYGAT